MNLKTRAFLQLPQGAESFYLDEAQRHEEILEELRGLYYSWGYLPVKTPVFDFYDIYRPLLDAGAKEKIYRLIDREGDLLMLRSDVTLFLAKQMGTILSGEDLPLRLWYADTILRHQDAEDISKNEFFQVGAELIGKKGAYADLEVLMMLVKSLEKAGLKDYYIHLGSREIFDRCFAGISEERKKALLGAIGLRDGAAVGNVFRDIGVGPKVADFLLRFFRYIGDADGLAALSGEGAKQGHLSKDVIASVSYLSSIWEELVKTGVSGLFRIDLSEVGGQPYYTGLVFQAFKEGVDSAFASGGRYDELLARYGVNAPSAGFSIMLRKIESLVADGRDAAAEEPFEAAGKSFAEAFEAAERARRSGRVARIEGEPHA